MVKDQASEAECTFCGRTSRKVSSSVSFNYFMEVYAGALFQYYNHVESEAIAWDSEDPKYVGSTLDTRDLVKYAIGEPSDNDVVIEAIIDSLGNHTWCERNPYSLGDVQRYQYSWDHFCHTVKHEVRYFFDTIPKPSEHSERIPVPEMLDELRDIIDEASLIGTVPAGTQFFRVRPHERNVICKDWRSLGSPPADVCVSNRMSAAGISVFYASMDMATSKAETTANLSSTDRRVLTGGTWTNTRPLNVLDLTKLPKVPSFYLHDRYDRDPLIFLREFVKSITRPVAHDGREHTEYVPTQILTEYFRHRYRSRDGTQLDAIVYPSTQHKGGRSIVIFASQEDLDPCPHEWRRVDRIPVLTLDVTTIKRLRRRSR